MKHFLKLLLAMLLLIGLSACDQKTKKKPKTETSEALATYWDAQSDLSGSMYSQSQTMDAIEASILALGSRKGTDPFAEWERQVNIYVQQSESVAAHFGALERLEDKIVPYGDDKGLLGSIARGIYKKAGDTVIASGQMVRSGFRVLTGKQSLRQVLRDPESGIPIVSSFAATLQKHNADRDAAIRVSIIQGDSQEGLVPLSQLPGNTPQEKANYYLNLSEEDPLKMEMRASVSLWDPDERARTAATAVELGKTGVRATGDAYGGGMGEWTNEIVEQHLSEGQTLSDTGKLEIEFRSTDSGTPLIQNAKTLLIDRVDMPESDPRITMIVDPPASFEQQLPSGVYSVIAMAEGFIRNVETSLIVVKNGVVEQYNQLLDLAHNAIAIDSITPEAETVTVGSTAKVNLKCFSSLGQNLEFEWSITGGTFTDKRVNKNSLSFKPTSEGRFEINCEIKDGLGNTKIAGTSILANAAKISYDGFDITMETFSDNKLNPGERATISFAIKNESDQDISGIASMEGTGGVGISSNTQTLPIPAGAVAHYSATLQVPANYSDPSTLVNFKYTVQDAQNNPVQLLLPIQIPVDFYVTINPIASPVTNLVLNVSGKVANPGLHIAYLVVDNDFDQVYELSLSNGNFNQQILINASPALVPHILEVTAYSGNLAATQSTSFDSQVLPNALRVTLSWDTDGTDVDLWVTDPNGAKCYYANPATASGLSLDVDDVNGYGPENITTSNIIPGDYLVQVHYYSDHNYYDAIGTYASIVIRINEGSPNVQVNYYSGFLADSGALWTVTTLHFDGVRWSLGDANSFSEVDTNTLPQK